MVELERHVLRKLRRVTSHMVRTLLSPVVLVVQEGEECKGFGCMGWMGRTDGCTQVVGGCEIKNTIADVVSKCVS